jgi:nucleotide-binding universal stress UspA family protein
MVRIKRILCPIDFSEFSRHAFDRSIAIARGRGASVSAIHVAPFRPATFSPDIGARGVDAFMLTDAERARLNEDLGRFLAPATVSGVPVTWDVFEAPSVHAEIVAQADRLGADLIVMGTHGRSGWQRLLMGSVTEKVLRTARPPVLTVGGHERDAAGGDFSFKHIVCAIDFSECSLAALRYAASLAEPAGASVTALYVSEWAPMGYDPLIGPPTDLAGYRLAAEAVGREHLRQVIAESGCRNIEEVVGSGKPYHEILRVAEEHGADLIVLGMHGRNPLHKMFFGSTAEPVVRRSHCPVLTVRSEPDASTAAA